MEKIKETVPGDLEAIVGNYGTLNTIRELYVKQQDWEGLAGFCAGDLAEKVRFLKTSQPPLAGLDEKLTAGHASENLDWSRVYLLLIPKDLEVYTKSTFGRELFQ